MRDAIKKLSALKRAESAIFRIHLRTAARQAILYAVGVVLILLAVAMLNVALFLALSEPHGPCMGALAVSALDGVLAAILLIAAGRAKHGPEVVHAEEVRNLAIEGLYADAEHIVQSLGEIKLSLQRIHTGLHGLLGGKGSMLGLLHLGPLLDLLISSLGSKKKASENRGTTLNT
jgi:hypothetical protein